MYSKKKQLYSHFVMSQFRESIHKHLVCTSFFYKPNRKNFCFKYTSKIKDKQTLNSAKQYTIQEKIESNFNTNENQSEKFLSISRTNTPDR